MPDAFDHFHSFMRPRTDRPWLIALSGGIDSVTLLHMAARFRDRYDGALRLQAAHFNHHLRSESAEDADFARSLCASLDIPLRIGDWHPPHPAGNLEANARTARYRFLGTCAAEWNDAYIVLAHHQDDQIETILMRLLRRAGPRGLAGMRAIHHIRRPVPCTLCRPLLTQPREQLRDYARAHALHWREDQSNLDTRRQRNHIRHSILPGLDRKRARVESALLTMAHAMRARNDKIDAVASEAFAPDTPGVIPHSIMHALPPACRARLIELHLDAMHIPVRLRRADYQQLAHLPAPDAPRTVQLSHDIHLRAALDGWRLHPPSMPHPQTPAQLSIPTLAVGNTHTIPLPGAKVTLHCHTATSPSRHAIDASTVQFDAAALAYPLTLRPRRPGESMRCFGGTRKTIKRMDQEHRTPHAHRTLPRVLTDANDIPLAVLGCARSHTAPLRDGTQTVLTISFHPETQKSF